MSESGEPLLVAATLDSVETGQQLPHFPPHMTVVRWFSMTDGRRHFLEDALENIFEGKDVYQHVRGGKKGLFGPERTIPVRTLQGVETYPTFALNALVASLGMFLVDDEFSDTFSPHVTDKSERTIGYHEQVAFRSVALFERDEATRLKTVRASYQLGEHDDKTTTR